MYGNWQDYWQAFFLQNIFFIVIFFLFFMIYFFVSVNAVISFVT